MIETLVVYLLLGAVAGLAAGLLGVGGGLVIVPVLALLFQVQGVDGANVMHLALGTSLTTIAFTAVASVLAHHRRGAVVWRVVFGLAGGMLLGGLAGAFIADAVSSDALRHLFALFEFAIGVYMIAGAAAVQRGIAVTFRRLELFLAGSVIGTVSAVLGIGGGTLTVPYLTWRGHDIRGAVAISAACGMPIALAGAAGYLLAGLDAEALPALATGFIYWPAVAGIVASSLLVAPLGARLAHTLPVARLRRVFGVVLLLMAALILTV